MSKEPRPKIVVIVGPTASGKSELAVRLAKKISVLDGPASGWQNTEIISADSRQIYKGMDIGTGKVAGKWRRANGKWHFLYKDIRHHLIDFANPRRQFTVAQYQKKARSVIHKLFAIGHLPIIVGGTGFYIDALLYNYKLPGVLPNPKLRQTLAKKSSEELFAKLKSLDPRRVKSIDRHNKRRLIRALEIVLATGEPVPPLQLKRHSNILKNVGMLILQKNILKIGIRLPEAELKRRIHARLFARLRRGMIKEVKKLRRQGLSWKRLEDFGLEYRWVSRYLRGLITRKEMEETLEKEIWRYAKRQMTWFKRDKEIHWIQRENEAGRLISRFVKK